MNHHAVHRIGRDTVMVALFILYPVIQVASTRSLPIAIAICLTLLLLTTLLGETRQWRNVIVPDTYSFPAKVCAAFLLAMAFYALLTRFWTPEPKDAVREGAMLMSLIVIPPILLYALRRTIIMDAPVAASVGIILGGVFITAELLGVTSLLNALSERAELYDLNRSTSWLALCLGPVFCYGLCRQVSWMWVVPACVLGLLAISLAQGQSAQLACLAGIFAALLVFWKQWSVVPLIATCALALFVAPLALDMVPSPSDIPQGGIADAAHIHHRIATWKAYAGALDTVPWYGLGANADEALGTGRSAVSDALASAGYDPYVRSPHTLLLEWQVNFSTVGMVLLAGAMISAAFAFRALSRVQTIAFTYVFITAFTAACTATEFLQGWWIAAIIVAFTLAALVGKPALKPGYERDAHKLVAAAENRA